MKIANRLLIYLSLVLCTLIVLFVFSLTPFVTGNRKLKSVSSALLNKKYEPEVSDILIVSAEQQTFEIKLEGGIWFGFSGQNGKSSDMIVFPLQQQTVNNFIAKLTKIQKMYIISDSTKMFPVLHLDEKNGVSVSVSGIDGSLYTKVYFGVENFDSSRISVRSASGFRAFQIDATIESYLTTKTSFWADPLLIPQSITGTLDSNSVQCLTFTDKIVNENKNLKHGDSQFGTTVQGLLPLRHGGIEKKQVFSEVPDAQLLIELGNGGVYRIVFYKRSKKDDDSDWIVQTSYTCGPAESSEKKGILSLLNYESDISSWTYNKIRDYFK